MKKFSILFLGFTGGVLLLWQLPWLYSFITTQKEKSPFVLYSPVLNDFTFSIGEGKKYVHTDSNGNSYTQAQIDSLHPVFYGRQLMTDSRFPDSIAGQPAEYKQVQQQVFYFKHAPRDINRPHPGVYQMMESMSGRVKLETPEDVFRVTPNGLTFVNATTNQIDRAKSERFTNVMREQGFVFPATYLAGNPIVKKDYDEGYLMLDAEKKLFHVKQVKGRPYVMRIELPSGVVAKHLFIAEFKDRKLLGLLTDENNRFYALTAKDHQLIQIAIPAFNPEENALMIYGMVYQWTIKVSSKKEASYYAIDGDKLTLLQTYTVPEESNWKKTIGNYVDRISIRFSDPLDKFIYPRIGV